jgi:hypothetical protein
MEFLLVRITWVSGLFLGEILTLSSSLIELWLRDFVFILRQAQDNPEGFDRAVQP